MQQSRKLLLTGAALFCRCAAWYPVWLLLLSLQDTTGMLPAMGVLLLCAFAAAAVLRTVRLHFRPSLFLPKCLAGAVVLLAAGASVFGLYRLTGGLYTGCILTALTLGVSLRHINAEPEQLFSFNAFAAFQTGNVLVTVLLSVAHLPVCSNLTLAVAGGISALYFLLRNQFTLLRYINRRSNVETDIPKDIRRSNLVMVCGVIALMAALWIFRAPLAHLLQGMADAAAKFAEVMLKLITKTVAALTGEAPAEENPVENADMVSQYYTGKRNPLWLILWVPIIAVTVHIWRVLLSDWIEELRCRLAAWLRRRKAGDDPAMLPANDAADFYDTKTVLRKEQSAKKKRAHWKKSLQRWQKQPDTAEKFYAGYRLLLEAPCWEKAELHDSDTVREICEKWICQHTPPELLNAVTAAFHADRYAGCGLPEGAVAAMDQALTALPESGRQEHPGEEIR